MTVGSGRATTSSVSPIPTEQVAAEIARSVLGRAALRASRFPTGTGNFVFDVTMSDGDRVVVRAAKSDGIAGLRGAVHWSVTLRPLGIPLPSLLYADLGMKSFPFPFVVLERFPGTDLGDVYTTISPAEKRALASSLVGYQRRVGQMPLGLGYGYAVGHDGVFPHATWPDAIRALLGRSRRRIAANGITNPAHVERVNNAMTSFLPDLTAIAPVPFLHDITTKKVIVHGGRLSGIVDVDDLCFGDPLLTVALTRMALLARGWDTDYIDYWCDAATIDRSSRRLDLYTAVIAVAFLSEVGHRFDTRDSVEPADPAYVTRLLAVLDRMLSQLAP